ncbi:hypothetical protein WH50_20375 [Pokkaliibacter plantistimulans]|uniref:Major facilitator superfamily (MFS) profile domain-containing protein n=1 Tax=Pokkaliibacter plantistimulans TaxID=1635171 RepID=A0ABX5LS69_9GAMM|nr:MFS transporter [Pokkaliibacter plantistimulans]PXF29501.1 hypothetical protein WH50_20375 [Pokkaliibacter plantistimulans]
MTVSTPTRWSAVWAMALGVFSLVTAEFLPASLLTPMGQSLAVSNGQAGQSVTVTAVVALIAGLLVVPSTRRFDRRSVLLSLSAMLIVSNVIVATAASLPVLLAGRVLLGVALGSFWSLAAATTLRFVPESAVPRALSLIFSGVPLATICAAAVGSYLGALLGWRAVFWLAAGLGVAALLWQWLTLPSMPATPAQGQVSLWRAVQRPHIGPGILAILLIFTAHFAAFTYIRPFLEGTLRVATDQLPLWLLSFGVANFIGTLLIGRWLDHRLRWVLRMAPLVMGVSIGLQVMDAGSSLLFAVAMLMLWALAFGATPVSWSTWSTRVAPTMADSTGALMASTCQLAISLGAACGGWLLDHSGPLAMLSGSAIVFVLAALMICIRLPLPASTVQTAAE